jgi:hypothetical protein
MERVPRRGSPGLVPMWGPLETVPWKGPTGGHLEGVPWWFAWRGPLERVPWRVSSLDSPMEGSVGGVVWRGCNGGPL